MSAPVDVLVVMDIAATSIEHSGGNVASLRQARTAVAELIDHGDRLTAAFRALGQSNGMQAQINAHRECEASMLAFAAALARVKGGAA